MSLIEDQITPITCSARTPMAYFERCKIGVKDGAIMAISKDLFESIPVATISSLWLGPGTSCTQEAMKAIHKRGCVVIFCGGAGLPAYSYTANYRSPKYKIAQFRVWSYFLQRKAAAIKLLNARKAVADEMGVIEWPAAVFEDLQKMEDIMLFEARCMKQLFKKLNTKHQVPKFPEHVRLLNHFLYSYVIPPIIHLGLDPNIGVIHGKNRGGGLVFDIADVFKPFFTIQLGYETIGSSNNELKARFLKLAQKHKLHKRIITCLEDLYGLGDSKQKKPQGQK